MDQLTRRCLLAGGVSSLLLNSTVVASELIGQVAWFACVRTDSGAFKAVSVSPLGRINFVVDLPGRGHGMAVSPASPILAVFARRPGRFALIYNFASGKQLCQLEIPTNRHFSGHGFFSPDGELLYATENDFYHERGVLGIYSSRADFQRVGEIDSFGIGPHEAILLRHGNTIAVANGGIVTHPELPRAKLNIESMEPTLTFIDIGSGKLLSSVGPPPEWHKLSIRHLAEDINGRVWLACQYEGAAHDAVPLIGRAVPGKNIDWFRIDRGVYSRLKQYVGSITSFDSGRYMAFSSPVGGLVIACNSTTEDIITEADCADVCGLAPDNSEFLATDGSGNLWRGNNLVNHYHWFDWDNHIVRTQI